MKKIYILSVLVLFLTTNLFAVSETVNLGTNPGTLSTLVNTPASVTDLIVTGEINVLDFRFMNTSMTTLANLDLSGATIVEYVDNSVSPAVTYLANTVPNSAFTNKTSLVSVKLPVTTETIGFAAFSGCTNLETVNYGVVLHSFGNDSFKNCSKLTSTPNNLPLTYVGNYSFYGTGITGSLILPEGLTTIGEAAFHSCQSLTSVTIPSTVTSILQGAFAGKTGTTSNILTFNIYATTPPALGNNVFLRRNVNSILHVPVGSKSTYLDTGLTSWTGFSQIIDDLQPVTTSIDTQFENTPILLLSNRNSLNITSEKKMNEIAIYDISGKTVYRSSSISSNTIDIPLFVQGVYIVKVSLSDGNNKTLKFVHPR